MAFGLDKIKRDFARHQKKAAFLGVLVLALVGFVVKAYFEMAPRSVVAENIPATVAPSADTPLPASAAETEEHLRQSQALWKTLREIRGVDAPVAFTFDSNYFNMDPSHRPVQNDTMRVDPLAPAPQLAVNGQEAERRARLATIRQQAQSLIVNSTVVGSGTSKPVAVINQHVFGVGDRTANGFEIIAIKAREVVFKKDGETLTVGMATDARGQ